MYPQDALSQYMSTNGTSTQSPSPTGTQTPAPVPPPMPGWAPYAPAPHAMPAYSYGYAQPMGPSATHQPLAPPGQYPWYHPHGPAGYHALQAAPPHAAAPASRGPPPPYSAPSGAITPSVSYRASSYNVPLHPTHPDARQGPRTFHPAGPRRYTRPQGAGPHGYYAQNTPMSSNRSQAFRPSRSDHGGSRDSPPHMDSRGSGSLDTPYSFNSDGGVGYPSGPENFGGHQQFPPRTRAAGTYALGQNGSLT